MAYYPQRSGRKFSIGQDGNSLVLLIAINLSAFIILIFILNIYHFTYGKEPGDVRFDDQILQWVTLPAHFPTFLERPWTILTHFIAHVNVWHILGNMLWLWTFGFILQDLSGNRKLGPIFIYGALTGAVIYMLAYNFIPMLRPQLPHTTALGASAGIMAIAVAATTLAPNYRIFPMLGGGIPLWVITLVYLIIDLALMSTSNTGGRIAHLAGGAFGWFYMFQLGRGTDLGAGINSFFDWINNLFDPDKPKKDSVKGGLFYKANKPPYKTTRSNVNQSRVDAILDKINQKGYNSLTDEEKEVLKRASKEDL